MTPQSIVSDVTASGAGIVAGLQAASALAAGASIGSVLPGIGTIVGAVLGIVVSLLHAGYNPRKLADTEVSEAAQLAYNALWYLLTGEDLGGVSGANGCVCQPGQCGHEHCAIFNQSHTTYPDVPSGPEGYQVVDVDLVMAKATEIYANGRAKLIRDASFADYDNNYHGSMSLFQEVAAARDANPQSDAAGGVTANVSGGIASAFSGLPAWAPLAAALGLIALVA